MNMTKRPSTEVLWRSVALFNLGVLALLAVGGMSARDDTVRTSKIELVNEDGVVVGSWTATDKGAVLSMESASQDGKILLKAESHRPVLRLDSPLRGGHAVLTADGSAMFELGNVSKGGYMILAPHENGSYLRIFSHGKKRNIQLDTGVVPGSRIWLGTADEHGAVGASITTGQGVVRWLEHPGSKPAKLIPPAGGGR